MKSTHTKINKKDPEYLLLVFSKLASLAGRAVLAVVVLALAVVVPPNIAFLFWEVVQVCACGALLLLVVVVVVVVVGMATTKRR